MSRSIVHICSFTEAIYEYEGYYFEWHSYCGPIPLNRKTHEPRKTIPAGFWNMIERFQKLSKEEKQAAISKEDNK